MNGFTFAPSPEYPQDLQLMTRYHKRVSYEAGRQYISNVFPDASLLYKSDRTGQLTHVAYGLIQPVLDARERFSRIQLPTHRFTEWYPFWHQHERLDSLHNVMVEAFAYTKYGYPLRRAFDRGQPLPDYLWYFCGSEEEK